MTNVALSVLLLAQASPERVGQYARLFAVVASLLGAFMLAVIVIGYLRRRRLERAERSAAARRLGSPVVDAWSEAGRREAPFTSQGGDADEESR